MNSIPAFKLCLVFTILLLFIKQDFIYSQEFYSIESGLNTLVFKEKHDLKVGFIFPFSSEGERYMIGYSPLNHVSLEAGFINTKRSIGEARSPRTFTGQNYMVAAGFYHSLQIGSKLKEKPITLNSSLKLGYTYGNTDTDRGKFQANFKYQKAFAQLGLGLDGSISGLNLFIKYNRLNYLEGIVINPLADLILLEKAQKLENRSNIDMLAFKARVHFDYKFIRAIIGMSFELNMEEGKHLDFLNQAYPYYGVILDLQKARSFFKNKTSS